MSECYTPNAMGEIAEATSGTGSVSVVIPTRNRPNLLGSTLQSVLCQTRPVDQIVIVDDYSDSTESLTAIAALSPTIELVRRGRQGGVSAARNDGLDRVRGEYLLFLDDDDLIGPRFVEAGLDRLTGNSATDGVFFRHRTIVSGAAREASACLSPNGRAERAGPFPFTLGGEENLVQRKTLECRPVFAFLRYLIPIHSGFLRRSALGATRFSESLHQGEDTHFWISLAARRFRFSLDERPFAVIRRHDGNTTRSRARYVSGIQPCYEKLLADGLLSDAGDVLLAHLKLLWFKTLTRSEGAGAHLEHLFRSPRLLAAEIGFWMGNFCARAGG